MRPASADRVDCVAETARSALSDRRWKVAEQAVAALSVTVLLELVPAQAPPQPPKNEPAEGTSLSVADELWGNCAEHVAPQTMPLGALMTTPVPCPALLTLSPTWGIGVSVAVAVGVAVGGIAVSVGVAVGGIAVFVGVAVGGTGVAVGVG